MMEHIDTNDVGKKDGRLSEVIDGSHEGYVLVKEMKIMIPEDYDPGALMMKEKDITEKYNDHVLTIIKDGQGFCFYSCKRKGARQMELFDKYSAKAASNLTSGKEYVVKIFRPGVRHRNPEDAEALAFIKAEPGSVLSGAQGLSVVWPVVKEYFSTYDAMITFDSKGILWVCGIGKENATDLGGIPHALKPRVAGSEDYFGTFGEEWDGDYHLLCVCELST